GAPAPSCFARPRRGLAVFPCGFDGPRPTPFSFLEVSMAVTSWWRIRARKPRLPRWAGPGPARGQDPHFKPRLEALEDRCLLSADPVLEWNAVAVEANPLSSRRPPAP